MKKNGRMGDKQSRTLKYKIYKINPDTILVLLFIRNNIWCIIISNYAKIIVRKIIYLFFTRMAGGVVNNPEPAGLIKNLRYHTIFLSTKWQRGL